MNLFTKRIGLLLSAVVGIGAIAALSIGASFSLFSATSPGTSTTFTAGTVSLNGQTSVSCPVSGLEPGTTGTCDFTVAYGGNLPAYIGAAAADTGVLTPELSFEIDGHPVSLPQSNPVVIGNSVVGSTVNPNGEVFTAHVGYTFSANADDAYQGQSAVVTVTFYAVQCSSNLAGYPGNANETCGSQGPASWADSVNVLYNSRIDWSAYQASQCLYCIGMNEFGNEINLAGGGGPLDNVVVDMANFNTTATTMPITFNIYDSDMNVIATDTQTFNIPAAPDGGYYGAYCQAIVALQPDSDCGIANFEVAFDFTSTPFSPVVLPSTVIYGIQYPDNQATADAGGFGGVNPQLSNETNQVSVGSDHNPGYLFLSYGGGPPFSANNDLGEITCTTQVGTTFAQYSTASGSSCGYGTPAYVPAVQFNS